MTNIKEVLMNRIRQIHFEGHRLCLKSFGKYFSNSGNMGIFAQSEGEYKILVRIQKGLVYESDNANQKYFTLKEPIFIGKKYTVTETTYRYLYIRKYDPTPYGKYLGDIDFYVDQGHYDDLLKRVKNGEFPGVRLYEQKGVGILIQLFNEDVQSLVYVSTADMCEKLRVRW